MIFLTSCTRAVFLSSSLFRSSALLAAANNKNMSSSSTASHTMLMTPTTLIGKMFDIEYASEHSKDTYRFQVLDESKIAWKRIAGTNVGQGDTEDYVITQLDDQKLLITWIEADGLGLSNVLDFTQGTCLTHGNNGRNVWKHVGALTLVADDHDGEHLSSTKTTDGAGEE